MFSLAGMAAENVRFQELRSRLATSGIGAHCRHPASGLSSGRQFRYLRRGVSQLIDFGLLLSSGLTADHQLAGAVVFHQHAYLGAEQVNQFAIDVVHNHSNARTSPQVQWNERKLPETTRLVPRFEHPCCHGNRRQDRRH